MKNFNRQPSSRINPDVYLSNKEYFDQGLIMSLENLVHRNADLRDSVDLYKLRYEKDKNTIRGLQINNRDLRAQLYNLKKSDKKANATADDLEKEIQKIYTILDEEIDSRDQIINGQDEIIKKQKEIIDEMRRTFKKMKFSDITNTNNPSSTYRYEDSVKNQSESGEQEEELEVKKPHPVSMRQSTGRKKGGQPGHPVHRSRLSSTPSRIIDKKVLKAPTGAEAVTDKNGKVLYYATQEINASFITEVTEIRYHISSKGDQLDDKEMKKYAINCVTYSARMKAQVLYLNNKGVIALDRLCTILNELSDGDLEISPASVTNWMREFDHASEEYRKNILEEMLNAWSLHVDETGFKVNGKNSWVHVLCTEDLAYYIMTTKRKDVDSGPLKLLEDYEHVLIHDHYKPYYSLTKCIHAECNEHILRLLKGGVDFDDIFRCQEMIELLQKSLHRKHELQDAGFKEMPEEEYREIEREYLRIIDEVVEDYYKQHPDIKTKYVPDAIKTLKRMKVFKEQHLLFLKDFDVEFENNAAEQLARICKISRKVSGQCASIETGNHKMAMLTVLQTASKQKENSLQTIENIINTGWPDGKPASEIS